MPAHLLLILALAAPAPPAEPAPDGWGAAAAVVPGALLGGAGHFVAGDREAASTLFWIKTGGLGALLLGGTALALTGASRRVSPVAVPVVGAGFGAFAGATLVDLLGAATGGFHSAPRRDLPPLTLSLGWRGVDDPQFSYGHLVDLAAEGWLGRFAPRLDATLAADADHYRLRSRLGWRALGAVRGRRVGDFLDVYGALAWQRFGAEGFSVLTPEVGLRGRSDLRWISRRLRGLFFEGGIGWALEFYAYDHADGVDPEEAFDLLSLRMGFGAYLGDGAGEVQLYYDHRRDDYAGGLSGRGIAVGIFGHAGLSAAYAVLPHWDLTADLQVGSAWVGGLGLRRRFGGSP